LPIKISLQEGFSTGYIYFHHPCIGEEFQTAFSILERNSHGGFGGMKTEFTSVVALPMWKIIDGYRDDLP